MSEGGILAIKGVKSQYYISMNKAGQLQGKVIFFLSEKRHTLFKMIQSCRNRTIAKHPFEIIKTKNCQ